LLLILFFWYNWLEKVGEYRTSNVLPDHADEDDEDDDNNNDEDDEDNNDCELLTEDWHANDANDANDESDDEDDEQDDKDGKDDIKHDDDESNEVDDGDKGNETEPWGKIVILLAVEIQDIECCSHEVEQAEEDDDFALNIDDADDDDDDNDASDTDIDGDVSDDSEDDSDLHRGYNCAGAGVAVGVVRVGDE